MYFDAVFGFYGYSFLCLVGCFSMIIWTPAVFECLICMCFVFLYLHLFSAIEHVSHGNALYKNAHSFLFFLNLKLTKLVEYLGYVAGCYPSIE